MSDATDFGPEPYVTNIEAATLANDNYRTTLWTGKNQQLTVMAIQPGHEIGLEVHHDHDQFLRIEQGSATVYMGLTKDELKIWQAADNEAVFVPAGIWHNLVNSGEEALKVYSIYAPPEHPHGTVQATKEQADAEANGADT
jgi:mannose-6-phosphate isomerase-like protein (cupin superfamily)